MDVPSVLKRSARYAWKAGALSIIGYALLVIIGRQFLPQLEYRQTQINQFFSEQLGVQLHTEHLSGNWTRLTPQFHAQGLSIALQNETPEITISSIKSEFNLLRSALNAEIIWNDLSIEQVKLTLREEADGSWLIGNFPISNPNNNTTNEEQLDSLLDIVLLSTHIGIEQINIDIAFFGGATTTVFINDIRIENEGDFHRLAAQLSIDEAQDGAELLIEGHGDPKDWKNFDGKAYINLKQVNLSGPLKIMLHEWLPPAIAKTKDGNTPLNAEFWIQSLKQGHFDLRGTLQADEIPLNWTEELPAIRNLNATLTGWFTTGDSWGLQWQNLQFAWGETVIKPLNLEFKQGLGAHWSEISLSADHINLETLKWSLLQTQLGGEKVARLLNTLNPSGELQGVHLSLNLAKPTLLTGFSTRIDHLSLDSWHHAPAIRELSGYLQWRDDQGTFDFDAIDGFAMHYPGVYEKFMRYGPTQGRINLNWSNTNSALKIAGGPIDINGREGQIRAYIALDIPFKSDNREPEMFLQAGIKNSHSRYRDNYLPAILDPQLMSWLEHSIGDTDIIEAGFIWRGSLTGKNPNKRSIQFYGLMANGEVDYDPGWPQLSELSAQITVDDHQFDGIISSAKLGQATLNKAVITTRPGPLLSIKADLSTPLKAAVNILLRSPMANRISALRDWRIEGEAKARLDLMIPLSKNRDAEAYQVNAMIEKGRMQYRDFNPLVFTELKGDIAYNDKAGLHSKELNGSLWGQAINAVITTQNNTIEIDASGLLNSSTAPQWHPLVTNNLTGTAHYLAKLTIPSENSAPKLKLTSDLQGISIELPKPLHKNTDEPWPFESSLHFRDTGLFINADTQNISTNLLIKNQQLTNGIIFIGNQKNVTKTALSKQKGLLVTGHIAEFNLDHWLTIFKMEEPTSQPEKISHIETRFIFDIDTLSAFGVHLNKANIDALYTEQRWDLTIDSTTLAGNILIPREENQPLVARLNFLSLPEPKFDSEHGFLNDLNPSSLPALDFATDGLRIGDDELGSLAFIMRPSEGGVDIDQIRAEITGISINDTLSESAQLSWHVENNKHRSHFSGALLSDDLGAVLKAWDMPMILTTDRAVFLADLNWQGKPWDASANVLNGHIALNFEKGRFFQAPGTTTNALIKVIGLINFDTWLRRLKFDFSDLFSKGVHYDHLEGGLAFKEGQMHFDEPIVVTLPSGKLRLLGSTNLIEETINSRLIATLPVGTNLPWIVALVGGLPAAAGVYITSRLFEKQVNKISSISYKIKGSLDNPKVEVDRIFSDKTQ